MSTRPVSRSRKETLSRTRMPLHPALEQHVERQHAAPVVERHDHLPYAVPQRQGCERRRQGLEPVARQAAGVGRVVRRGRSAPKRVLPRSPHACQTASARLPAPRTKALGLRRPRRDTNSRAAVRAPRTVRHATATVPTTQPGGRVSPRTICPRRMTAAPARPRPPAVPRPPVASATPPPRRRRTPSTSGAAAGLGTKLAASVVRTGRRRQLAAQRGRPSSPLRTRREQDDVQ
jgi:hypothetical protein